MKAIVGTTPISDTYKRALQIARDVDAGIEVPEADYHLNFSDAAQLFGELTVARVRLLDTLKAIGPVSIYALAKKLKRNYSNVHSDVGRLLELDLIEKDADNMVFVPWEAIQIQVSLDGSRSESDCKGEARAET